MARALVADGNRPCPLVPRRERYREPLGEGELTTRSSSVSRAARWPPACRSRRNLGALGEARILAIGGLFGPQLSASTRSTLGAVAGTGLGFWFDRRFRRLEIRDPVDSSLIYLTRWRLIHAERFSLKLHRISLSDNPARGLHDHPWSFVSIRLRGSYREHLLVGDEARVEEGRRISFRRAHHLHRIELLTDAPCWTLVLTGPRVRPWGFSGAPGQTDSPRELQNA